MNGLYFYPHMQLLRHSFYRLWLLTLLLSSLSLIECNKKNHINKRGGSAMLQIQIDSLDAAHMFQLRETALTNGVISPKEKRKFPCVISHEGKSYGAEIRFKGDWTDHLEGTKWSYRVELNDGRILGKKTFSLQNPSTRGYGQEWLMHQMLQNADVLTTAYSFLPVSLNGEYLGVYAFEEHFEKFLLESQNRREGVILKYDESLFWEARLMEKNGIIPGYFPVFEACQLLPFGKKKVLSKPTLEKQLQTGLDLLGCHKNSTPGIENYIDLERFAKYYATLTLANSWHGAAWHNQRFYFNPITAKLEPVVFDIFGHPETKIDSSAVFTELMTTNHDWPTVNPITYYERFLFTQDKFLSVYLKELKTISDSAYLMAFFDSHQGAIDSINQLLKIDPEIRTVDTDIILRNAQLIQDELPVIEAWCSGELRNMTKDTINRRPSIHAQVDTKIPLRAYRASNNTYVIENHGGKEVEVITFREKRQEFEPLDNPISVGVTHWKKDIAQFESDKKIEAMQYRLKGDSTLRDVKTIPWHAPVPVNQRLTLMKQSTSAVFRAQDNTFLIPKGNHSINDLLYIPKGSKLTVEAGAHIEFIGSAGILSESPIKVIGTEMDSIYIKSSSLLNQGLTVLQSVETSTVSYVNFSGLANFSAEGWQQTGAVNFNESEVVISNSSFKNSQCEDALNIVRSAFKVDQCCFNRTRADAFDADFSNGVISSCIFENVGNDALDFSGSAASVIGCKMKEIGDKAISAGERSAIAIQTVDIMSASVGISSKDCSTVSGEEISIAASNYGFAAYTKKTEYGGASITVNQVEMNQVEHPFDIELLSTLRIDGDLQQGTSYSTIQKR